MVRRSIFWMLAAFLISCAFAQEGDVVGEVVEPAGEDPQAVPAEPPFRDLSGYAFGPLSRTVRDMQHLAYAMQLRDYCADPRIADEFVRVQLARFSLITGRPEDCQTLLNY